MIAIASVLGLAALTFLVPAAPDYDAWAYLTWGREVAHLDLSTEGGPAFKPLPVAICALLAPLGSVAPDAWLAVVRVGALAAVVLAAVIAAQIVPRRRVGAGAAAAAAVGVLATGGFLRHAAGGDAEPLVVAFALGAWHRHRGGRRDQALMLALVAALVRVETWPFVAAYAAAIVGIRRALLLGVAVLAAWFLPELAGSGELLRSGERASVPNPGAPALAERPFLASLGDAAGLLPLPLAIAALLPFARIRDWRAHPELAMSVAGIAWCVLVAVMSEAGFSGEARYAMPGVALIAVAAAVALVRLAGPHHGRTVLAAAIVVVAATAAVTVREQRSLPSQLEYRDGLVNDLHAAIERAGGRDRLLACGRPAVGRYRGTMTAYALEVEKRQVRADGRPDAVTLRSRLGRRDPVEPRASDAGRVLARGAHWTIVARCQRRSLRRTSTTTGTRPTATSSSAGNAAVS